MSHSVWFIKWSLVAFVWCFGFPSVQADEQAGTSGKIALETAPELLIDSLEDLFVQIAQKTKNSIVAVTPLGRNQESIGLGTGFVIDVEQGLIATNRHVLGEARPITLRLHNGVMLNVLKVHATDSQADLAILQVEAKALQDHKIPALVLGSEKQIEQGELVAAIGHPQGLENTLVSGLVSGYQEILGQELIQVAMPIEHGNSGGPLLNRRGEVVGVITYKSTTTSNTGYAMQVAPLKKLLEAPNPIAMERWATIGVLNPEQWTPLMGANWRQRAGRIHVSGSGQGFGGRSLCLWQEVPEDSQNFELSVQVKLEDESGAAGLVFQSDEKDCHYGFYPSNGQLRLSRFDGPDVFRWQVLREVPAKAYRRGEWNQLKVRVAGEQIQCFCNGELIFELKDQTYTTGKVGLAKFRETVATFRKFSLGESAAEELLTTSHTEKLKELLSQPAVPDLLSAATVDELSQFPENSGDYLEKLARSMEEKAQIYRVLARRVHEQRIREQIRKELATEKPSLSRLAFLLARYDNAEVDIPAYEAQLSRFSQELQQRMQGRELSLSEKQRELNQFLFQENGFHGSRTNYYSQSNSYLNEVIDDREGLPVSLSVLYISLGQQLGLDLRGIGIPGHFIVCHYIDEEPVEYIDVFREGKPVPLLELMLKLSGEQRGTESELLKPQSPRQILARMVRNLKQIAEAEEDLAEVLRYTHLLVEVDTENMIEHRYLRALILIRNQEAEAAREDLEWLETSAGEKLGEQRLRELRMFADRWLR